MNLFGPSGKSNTESGRGSGSRNEQTGNRASETSSGSQSGISSEFIETTVEAMGGKPEIAASIMDFYTPGIHQFSFIYVPLFMQSFFQLKELSAAAP